MQQVATTNPTADVRHVTVMTYGNDTLLRQHTIASITLAAGSTKRTVQRWVAKCGDVGILRDGTRYFSDSEKAEIMAHQSRKPAEQTETMEAELIEPGVIELHTSVAGEASPLVQFNLEPIELALSSADTTALDTHTAQLEKVAQQGANAITQALTARFGAGIAQIVAKQDNLLRGIEAQALNGAAQSISQRASQ